MRIPDPLAPIAPSLDDPGPQGEVTYHQINSASHAILRRSLGVIIAQTGDANTNEAKAIRAELKHRMGYLT